MHNQFARLSGREITRIRRNGTRSFDAPLHVDRLFTANSTLTVQTKVAELPKYEAPSYEVHDISSFVQLSDTLEVTRDCLNRVQSIINQRIAKGGDDFADHFLRVYVGAVGGCHRFGFQYQFEVDSDIDVVKDIVVVATEDSTPRVVVDDVSLGFLKGSKLDYAQEMIKSSFVVVDNPQSASGCGSYFAMRNFEAKSPLLHRLYSR